MIYEKMEDFKFASQQYLILKQKYQQGQIDITQYQSGIDNLQGKDIFGCEWAIDEERGQWGILENGIWKEKDPESVFNRPNTPVKPKATQQKKKRGLVAAIILIVFVSCICVCAIGVGTYSYFSGDLAWLLTQMGIDSQATEPFFADSVTPTENNLEDLGDFSFNVQHTKTFTIGEMQVLDSYQGSALFPEESLEEGLQGQVVVSEPDSVLKDALEEYFELKSSFYQFTATGENDGTGSAQFSLPSSEENLYFLEIFDEKYISLSPLPGTNGAVALSVPVRAISQDEGNDSISFRGSYAFAVVSPRVDTSQKPGTILARYQTQADPRNCGVTQKTQYESFMEKPTRLTISICRMSLNGKVKALYYPPETPKVSTAQVDQVVDLVTQILAVYQNEGFNRAKLEDYWFGVPIVIKKGGGNPVYSVGNGTIYIPEDSLGHENLEYELAHELAHWIQDDKYNMSSSYWKNFFGISSSQTWWLENSAENMVMLYKPNYIERNITTYGPSNISDSKTPFQFAPLTWNDQLYVHAQLLKVFTCERPAVCPINQAKFTEAINKGTYPFDSSAVDLISKNINEYARYLLGNSPQQANSTILIMPAVKTGKGFGDFAAPKLEKNISSFEKIGYAPQMKMVGGVGEEELHIQAPIDKGGVYPLTVGLPTNLEAIGNPVVIEVEPGTPFYYRLGSADIQYADGKSKVSLGPVHSALGVDKVRIVAVAGDGAKVFKAQLKSINLEGDWLFMADRILVNNLVCDDPDGAIKASDEQFAKLTALYTSWPAAASGKYVRDAGGTSYTWEGNPNNLQTLQGDTDSVILIQGVTRVSPKGIRIESSFSLHNKGTSRPQDGSLMALTSAGALGLALFNRKKKMLAIPLLGLFVICFISACGAWGVFETDMNTITTLDKIELAAGKTIAELVTGADLTSANAQLTPLFVCEGESVSTIDFLVKIGVMVGDSLDEKTSKCTGTLTYRVQGFLFEDGVITEKFINSGE